MHFLKQKSWWQQTLYRNRLITICFQTDKLIINRKWQLRLAFYHIMEVSSVVWSLIGVFLVQLIFFLNREKS